jgi:hypothetical protein
VSAAVGNIIDAGSEDASVREWLSQVTAACPNTDASSPDPTPQIAAVCSSAVAPLEIAAALEAAGMSQQAVQETTRHHDVFSLAHELWQIVPFVEADVRPAACWRRGNVGDLGRGALYAAPALIIHGLATAGHFRFSSWTLPLAMTLGWAMGQLTSFGGYRMRGRNDARGEARITSLLLLVAVVATAACGWLAQRTLGGGVDSVICATAITTYMVASSILLLHEEEWLGALLLAPAAVASLAGLFATDAIPDAGVVWTIAGSGAATLFAAAGHMGWPWIRRSAVTRKDLGLAAQHFLHGVMCGLALSIVLLLGTGASDLGSRAAVASIPLLLTLGLMEWRLRTFRAGVETLAREARATDQFRTRAVGLFVRGLAVYAIGVVAAGAAVALFMHLSGSPVPAALLAAELALGSLYYVDLTLTSLGRLDFVLRAWIAAIVCAAAALATAAALGADFDTAGWWSAHAGVWIALIVLLTASPRIVAAPCSH